MFNRKDPPHFGSGILCQSTLWNDGSNLENFLQGRSFLRTYERKCTGTHGAIENWTFFSQNFGVIDLKRNHSVHFPSKTASVRSGLYRFVSQILTTHVNNKNHTFTRKHHQFPKKAWELVDILHSPLVSDGKPGLYELRASYKKS